MVIRTLPRGVRYQGDTGPLGPLALPSFCITLCIFNARALHVVQRYSSYMSVGKRSLSRERTYVARHVHATYSKRSASWTHVPPNAAQNPLAPSPCAQRTVLVRLLPCCSIKPQVKML